MPEVLVLLTPREIGGHESALFGWLADAVRDDGLGVEVFAPAAELRAACDRAGLPLHRETAVAAPARPRLALLRALWRWPAHRPLLLAPGVLHAAAWLTAAACLLRRRVWIYVPNAHSAARMGYRAARWRDALLAPWLRRVEGFITVDEEHVAGLRLAWSVRAPVFCLGNLVRLPEAPGLAPPPPEDALRIAWVGRFDARTKGLDWLAALLHRRPAWAMACRWRFQGRGPAEALLLELASALGPQRVRVHAFAPLDDALAASDVLLLASRYEGVPLVALEATQRGWPVVASRQSGVERLLPAGSLFEFGDEAGLRAALASMRDPASRRAAVAYARAQLEALWPASAHIAARRAIVQAWRAGGVAA